MFRRSLLTIGAITIAAGGFVLAVAGEGEIRARDPDTTFPDENLAMIDRYVGTWILHEFHFSPSGTMFAKNEGTEEIFWILDVHALQRKYWSKSESRAYEALGTLTYNKVKGVYQGTWYDNVNLQGPMVAEGRWDPKTDTMTYVNTATSADGREVRYEIVDKFQDDEHRFATTSLVEPDGKKTKVLEVSYLRAQACPPRGSTTIIDN